VDDVSATTAKMPMPTAVTRPRPSPATLGAIVGVALALAALWRFTPLGSLLDPHALAAAGARLRASPAAPVLVIAAYVVGALVLFPITPLLVATALIFEPGRGLALGLAGALASATLTYGLGRLVGRRRPRWLEGPRFTRLRARLQRRGVLTMAAVRLVPAGNFTLSNVAAGALGIPLRHYLLGNLLGMLPSLLAVTLLADHLRRLGWGGH
jgi:phospholipase D1/2